MDNSDRIRERNSATIVQKISFAWFVDSIACLVYQCLGQRDFVQLSVSNTYWSHVSHNARLGAFARHYLLGPTREVVLPLPRSVAQAKIQFARGDNMIRCCHPRKLVVPDQTHNLIWRTITESKSLESLDLHQCPPLRLIPFFRQLTDLTIRGSFSQTSAMASMLSSLTALRSLFVTIIDVPGYHTVLAPTLFPSGLESLTLRPECEIDLVALASHFPNLNRLHVSLARRQQIPIITNRRLTSIGRLMDQYDTPHIRNNREALSELRHLEWCPARTTVDVIGALVDTCPLLERLEFQGNLIRDMTVLTTLAKLTYVSLNFRWYNSDERHADVFVDFGYRLRRLNLMTNGMSGRHLFDLLRQCHELQEVSVVFGVFSWGHTFMAMEARRLQTPCWPKLDHIDIYLQETEQSLAFCSSWFQDQKQQHQPLFLTKIDDLDGNRQKITTWLSQLITENAPRTKDHNLLLSSTWTTKPGSSLLAALLSVATLVGDSRYYETAVPWW